MLTIESIMSIEKSNLQEAAKSLSKDDIPQLVEWLSLKDDNMRYQVFLLLQNRSRLLGDVYPYWHTFCDKLKSDNSYQRSIGLMLIAENVKWDIENQMVFIIDEYLEIFNDDKPITVRQCIQALEKIVPYKPDLISKIAESLIKYNLMSVKETMRKSILLDILNVLFCIGKSYRTDDMDGFIIKALSGDLLDKKSKKQIEALFKNYQAVEAPSL